MQAPFPTYNHMWYVLYLITYTFMLIPLFNYINAEKGKASLARLERWLSQGARVVWLPLCLYFVILLVMQTNRITHAFYDDFYAHGIYLLALIMGLFFVRMPTVLEAFERNRLFALVLALVGYGILLTLRYAHPALEHLPVDEAGTITKLVVKWTWMAMILGYARHYMNFNNRGLAYCSEVVYPFFILHQSVIIVIGFYVIDWGMPGTVEFFTIALGTFTVCGLLTEFVIKKVNFLRIMFGLKLQRGSLFYRKSLAAA